MEPTSAAHILQQSDELQKITKELDKCRADKEFVWGLWKKLQKTNPDLNAAIEMVVAREKSSHQQRLDQLLAYGQEKETHFNKLSEEAQELSSRLEEDNQKLKLSQSENLQLCDELSALQSALGAANQRAARCEEKEREHRYMETALEVLQQQLSAQELAFKSQVTEMSDKTRQLAAENRSLSTRALQAETGGREMQEKLNEFGQQLRAVRDECNERVEASHSLDQLLSSKREELEQKGRELESARRDTEDISGRLSECVAEGERHKLSVNETRSLCNRLQSNLKETEEQLTCANSLNQMLSNKVSEDAREISHLKGHMKELESSKIHRIQLQHNETYTQTDPRTHALDSTTAVVQLLESKSIETDQLRKSHDRRLQRYKELQATNKLLIDQLSTYAPDAFPAIQHQEAERALNEMSVELVAAQSCDGYAEVLKKLKSSQEENVRLTGTIFSMEETLDELRCEKVHLESVVVELMYSVEQDRASIIARLASLRSIGSDTDLFSKGESGNILERKFSLELKIEELEECLLLLETDRNEWNKEHHKLISEYQQLATEMEQCNVELEQKDIILRKRENEINLLKEHTPNSTQHKHTCTSPSNVFARSVPTQTAQQLLLKHYPPLRHAYTQTALMPAPETPIKQSKSSLEVKSLQKRVSSLSRQVEVLSETRNHLKSCLEEEQDKASEIETLLNDTLYKFKVSRAENSSLSSEALVLRQANAALEESLQTGTVERESETSALFSRLEARLKSSSEECSKQAGTLYRLNREAQEKRSQLDSLTDCSLRKEREHKQNLAQKRHLLEDMREQTHKLKANLQSNEELVRKQAAEIKRLTDANTSANNRNSLLKEQVVRVSQERELSIQELQQAKQALIFHTQQLDLSQTECSRKIQLLKAAKTQIDHLSDLFGEEEDTMRSADLEKQLIHTTACIDEYRQTVLCISELVWCRKFNRQGGGQTKDILSFSAQEMLEIAKLGGTAVTTEWTDTNQYLQIVSVLEKPPPFALRLAELILSILDM